MSKKAKKDREIAESVLTDLELGILRQAKTQPDTPGMKKAKAGAVREAMELLGETDASALIAGCELPLTVDELVALRFVGQVVKKPTADNVKAYALLRGDLKDGEVNVTMSKVDENLVGYALPDDDAKSGGGAGE